MSRISLDQGFSKADSGNLPKVTSFAMANFFKSANFIAPEQRNRKTERSMRESYSDEAVGYVQVGREGGLCHVKALITPEHRVRSKGYSVLCIIKEADEEILKAVCEDCAACEGGCKHAVAFVTWLHRRSEERAVTDTACYWKKSRLATVGSTRKFIRADELKPQEKDTTPDVVKQRFLAEASNILCRDSLLKKHLRADDDQDHSVFHLMLKFKSQNFPPNADDFIKFASERLALISLDSLAAESKAQSSSSFWHSLRFGRITASNLYEASKCSTDGSLVNTILGAAKFKPTPAMQRGTLLEKEVIETVSAFLGLQVESIGLIIRQDQPIFGASPDGISSDYVWEVKCPCSRKAFESYFNVEKTGPSSKHNAQMQLQMYLAGKSQGIFCVAHPDFEESGDIHVSQVDFDLQLVLDLMEKATEFWKRFIFPKLYSA